MANRSIEMFEYRQAVLRMRQGDTDRAIARADLMGRKKASALREVATEQGWLDPERALPTDAELASFFARAPASSSVSPLE